MFFLVKISNVGNNLYATKRNLKKSTLGKDEHVLRAAAELSYSVYHYWAQEGLDQGLNHQPEKSQPEIFYNLENNK